MLHYNNNNNYYYYYYHHHHHQHHHHQQQPTTLCTWHMIGDDRTEKKTVWYKNIISFENLVCDVPSAPLYKTAY